ncbi:uncharacterized protein [Atheta coriaria]|uniref:uncharacterized protein n=1 Tax=Dalotia coriaria TaxID=877792 RepID=UPI0031F3D3A3
MQQRTILGCNWARGGEAGSGVVRRAHPASGAQWNVQVVRGKVNGKCLWNACKALSIGLLLMLLGGAMATIGYYADDLSMAHEVRGNHTVKIKNESRGFHLNNLSYAGPIVMGVGGFIVVAACVMTFEARDSAAKVVPARLKSGSGIQCTHRPVTGDRSAHGSLRTSASQTGVTPQPPHQSSDRRAVTQSLVQFSKGLVIDSECRKPVNLLRVSQNSISKSPSAPDLSEQKPPMVPVHNGSKKTSPSNDSCKEDPRRCNVATGMKQDGGRRMITPYGALNPKLLHRHALSVDETAHTYRLSHESLQGTGSQCSMALDLHLECPVTLRIRDRRRNPLRRQCKIEAEDEKHLHEQIARSNSHSPRMTHQHRTKSNASATGSPGLSPSSTFCGQRRSSNASDCTHRARTRKRDCHHQRGRLERAISSDSRLTGVHHKCHHHHHHHVHPQVSVEEAVVPGASSSDTDITHTRSIHPKI